MVQDQLHLDQLLHHTEADEDDTEHTSIGTDGDPDNSSPSLLSGLCWPHLDVRGFNSVPDALSGKLLVAAPSLLWGCQRYHRGWRGSGTRVGWDVWRWWMLKWIFAPRHREKFPSVARWGRSRLPPEDHGKSSTGSSELISCTPCPHLAEAGHKSTCFDLPVADAVVSIETYSKAVSAQIWTDVALSSSMVPGQRRDAHLTGDGTRATTTLCSLPETPTDMSCSFTDIFYYLKNSWSPDLVSLPITTLVHFISSV